MNPTNDVDDPEAPGQNDEPFILLIGGTAGCGKTSLANHILSRLDLDHRLGTGFVRAIIQSQTDPALEPTLFRRSYQSDDPVGNVRAQSVRLFSAVRACIDRARAEGTSLVVEGTHLLPELYHDMGTAFVILEHPEPVEHHQRLLGPRHKRRAIAPGDLERIREIGAYFLSEANRFGVPTLLYVDNLEEILERLV